MKLNSVESPRPAPSAGSGLTRESATTTQPREVLPGNVGPGTGTPSRARGRLLVSGTRAEPLRPPARRGILESLIGPDDRVRILETELDPWRMICALEITAQDGRIYIGTGWLAGRATLITAGHCVFDPVELGGWAKRIGVMAGRDGDEKPFDQHETARYVTVDQWKEAQDADYDYAAILLDHPLGDETGWFRVGSLPNAELRDRLVNVSGYPVDRGNGREQYFHANRVRGLTTRRMFYDVDTVGGQSGSPVWIQEDGQPPLVVGIHAYGVGGAPGSLGAASNSGPRVLPEVLEQIRAWVDSG